MSTPEIQEIYKKAQVLKFSASKKLQDQMNASIHKRITDMFAKYFDLLKDPKVAVGIQDELKRDMNKTLDIIIMDSDHDVIMALTNMAIEKKYKDKMKLG